MTKDHLVHISSLKVGDVVRHNGREMTVGRGDIRIGFMGRTLFGDSYRLGSDPVVLVTYQLDEKSA